MALPIVNSSRYSTKLPSTGEEIEYRPYLVKEEKIMMVALESKDNKQIMRAMKDIIKACVFKDNFNIESLTSYDIEWMFIKLRSVSVGEMVTLNMPCQTEECKAKTEIEFNLGDVKISDNPDPVVQITDEVGVKMKHPGMDIMETFTEEKLQTLEGAFDLVKCSMDVIYDKDDVYPISGETDEDVKTFLDSLSTEQFKKMVEWIGKTPTVKSDIEWKCIECAKENTFEVRGINSFFT
jgi:hypothetical protein|tara:strand:- start:6 stop:716 length:711 start_codon:yes stop_codon:yes gene_type:complete